MSKRILFSSTTIAGVIALAALTPAWAQDTAAPQNQTTQTTPLPQDQTPANDTPDVTPTAQDQDEDIDEVVVTGSRLRLPDYRLSNPVVSVDDEAIAYSGTTNLTDFLQDIPALVNSTDLQDNADAGNRAAVGLNLLNLRNLGSQRTLVLVDGRRHVSGSPGSSSVDVNTIPVGLIERVEVLTGGASAIYGADGVSGVVNFVLKDDFEGLDVRAQTGWSDQGGGENSFISVLGGRNFAGDRGNVTLSAEYSTTEALERDQREYTRLGNRETLVENPADLTGDDPNVVDNIFARNVRYIDTALEGAVYSDDDFGDSNSGVDFTGDGRPWDSGVYAGSFFQIGGSGTPLEVFQTQLLPALERASVNGSFGYQLTPQARFFAEGKLVRTNTQFRSQPTFDYGLFIPLDNPFIPASILADASRPGTGAGDACGGLLVGRDNLDLGEVVRDVERDTYRFTAGLEGDFFEGLAYEMSYVWGRSKETNTERNNRINERFFAAIDAVRDPATGKIVCRSDLDPDAVPVGDAFSSAWDPATFGTTFTPGPNSGCVPANIFGQNVSPEARAWINTSSTSESQVTQQVLTAFVSGNTERYLQLPAGGVSFVLGAEYRKEESEDRASPDELLGAELETDITWLGQGLDTLGEFDVYELFGEVSVPLIQDQPFFQALTVNAAYRFSDYSTVSTTNTYNVGGVWRLNPSLMFRATQARAVRAPNISELFLPQQQTFAILNDPCDRDNVNAGTSLRFANCQAALGFNPNNFNVTTSSSTEGVIGGNPDLDTEKADTFTAGVVLTPTFLRGLSASIDYYDIVLEDAINFFDADTILENCYDLPQPNQFCGLFTRSPTTRFVNFFQQIGVNVAEYRTSGYDFSIRYRFDPNDFGFGRNVGTFNFTLVGNKLEELTFVELENAEPDESLGDPGAPEWQVAFDATWLMGDFAVNYGLNYFSETRRFSQERQEADPDYIDPEYFTYSERLVHDLQVRYTLQDRYTVYAGVNNLGNQEPDRGAVSQPVSPLGRFFYVGGRVSLDTLPMLRR